MVHVDLGCVACNMFWNTRINVIYVLFAKLDVKCREFEERYEVEMKIDNKQQKMKLDVDFLPANHLAKNEVKLTIKAVSGR